MTIALLCILLQIKNNGPGRVLLKTGYNPGKQKSMRTKLFYYTPNRSYSIKLRCHMYNNKIINDLLNVLQKYRVCIFESIDNSGDNMVI